MPFLIDDEWARRLPKMWRWMRSFRIDGPGVSTKNTDETFTASVSHSTSRSVTSSPIVTVKITGHTIPAIATLGGGKYTGRILRGTFDASATNWKVLKVAMPEGRTLPDADDAIVVNVVENNLGTHALDNAVTSGNELYIMGVTRGQISINNVNYTIVETFAFAPLRCGS